MRNLLNITLSVCLLAGCAPLLQDLQDINANLRNINTGMRTGTSGIHSVSADREADVCDRAAFDAGFRDRYITNWNGEIGQREMTYSLMSKHRPWDKAAQQNYALYKGKRLDGKQVGDDDYSLKFDTRNGRILNDCQASSYTQGETAGIRAARRDLKALADQEI